MKEKAEDKATKVRLESVPDYRATMALEYSHEKTTAVLSLSHQGKTKARPGNNVTTLDSSTLCNFYIRQQCNKDFAVYLKIANRGDLRSSHDKKKTGTIYGDRF